MQFKVGYLPFNPYFRESILQNLLYLPCDFTYGIYVLFFRLMKLKQVLLVFTNPILFHHQLHLSFFSQTRKRAVADDDVVQEFYLHEFAYLYQAFCNPYIVIARHRVS